MQKYLAAILNVLMVILQIHKHRGGAVYAENVDITDCFFLDCVALDAGGAIYNVGGTITDCLFRGCYAREGGAIYSTGLLRDNEIISSRGLIGGGIYNLALQ